MLHHTMTKQTHIDRFVFGSLHVDVTYNSLVIYTLGNMHMSVHIYTYKNMYI